MQIKQLLRFALLLGATFSLLSTVRAEDWPQFRGPNASGVASQTYALPTEFSFTDKVKWSATLGDGIGSPIVVEGRVFITAMVGEDVIPGSEGRTDVSLAVHDVLITDVRSLRRLFNAAARLEFRGDNLDIGRCGSARRRDAIEDPEPGEEHSEHPEENEHGAAGVWVPDALIPMPSKG